MTRYNTTNNYACPPAVIAPFSNEGLREWPLGHYRRFLEIGIEDGQSFVLCGSLSHRAAANELVRSFPTECVKNYCGLTSWSEVTAMVHAAPFIVANNSGIAHLAASMGKLVLCIFGGRHSWKEWMPRGPKVLTIARTPPCSPCDKPVCSNDFACLRGVSPDMAYEELRIAISCNSNSL
ncbi:hypothetical protein DY926_14860 [Komagataeibacter melaceti]|uniref:Glycosyltransferase family 9 protein n=1 Tax=Komagataeibacter melaceti TaxID=2766577 RepID=A0A371YX15_9PROT|nr:hypothetical protein DY926_14860 [Komagataeibacter melaceti]